MSWCGTETLVKQNVMKFEVFILGGQRIDQKRNKMLGRALDPRANGTWLSKLTE